MKKLVILAILSIVVSVNIFGQAKKSQYQNTNEEIRSLKEDIKALKLCLDTTANSCKKLVVACKDYSELISDSDIEKKEAVNQMIDFANSLSEKVKGMKKDVKKINKYLSKATESSSLRKKNKLLAKSEERALILEQSAESVVADIDKTLNQLLQNMH
ncbi:MAG: hypothetical protein WDK96_00940 [Candidatus Paceibacterota bacterium]|jgi:conjugal transfer/entry exclusion protein